MAKQPKEINAPENPLTKIIDSYVSFGKFDTAMGLIEGYVVKRADCFEIGERAIRDFIKRFGHDDMLPYDTVEIEKLITAYKSGQLLL